MYYLGQEMIFTTFYGNCYYGYLNSGADTVEDYQNWYLSFK
jgi:hypothetical protein